MCGWRGIKGTLIVYRVRLICSDQLHIEDMILDFKGVCESFRTCITLAYVVFIFMNICVCLHVLKVYKDVIFLHFQRKAKRDERRKKMRSVRKAILR